MQPPSSKPTSTSSSRIPAVRTPTSKEILPTPSTSQSSSERDSKASKKTSSPTKKITTTTTTAMSGPNSGTPPTSPTAGMSIPRQPHAEGRRRRPSEELLIDDAVLTELDTHARAIASSVDMALRDLRGSLRGMADLTLESSQLFHQGINSTCDQMDAAIKATYSMLAKTEELCTSMKDVEKLAKQVRETKKLVDQLESKVIAKLPSLPPSSSLLSTTTTSLLPTTGVTASTSSTTTTETPAAASSSKADLKQQHSKRQTSAGVSNRRSKQQ